MPARIIVANKCAHPRGYIIQIISVQHKLSKNESKKEWEAAGNSPDDWARPFSSVIVLDKTVDEMMFLRDKFIFDTGVIPEGEEESIKEHRPKYIFSEPDPNSDLWQELYQYGEVEANYDTVMQYVMDLE